MSGTARAPDPVSAPSWYDGLDQTTDSPPPPAPGFGTGLPTPSAQRIVCPWQSFQTACVPADPPLSAVPPALTTFGCEPGSSTASARLAPWFGKQSSEPASPDAAIMVCPCRAMREKIPFSSARKLGSLPWMNCSQLPQLVVTTRAVSLLAIWLKRSREAASLSLGAS